MWLQTGGELQAIGFVEDMGHDGADATAPGSLL
jgi:hypothetical protein